MTQKSWRELSLYESRDYVAKRIRERHKGKPRDKQSRDIASHVVQARQYFESAAEAGSLIRPLLLYYGVLALSRAIILMSDPHKESGQLEHSHGVKIDDWSGLDASDPTKALRALAGLQVAVDSGGTFPELCLATQNRERWRTFSVGLGSTAQHQYTIPGSDVIPPNTSFDLKALLARSPDSVLLNLLYESIGERPDAYFVNFRPFSYDRMQLEILSPVEAQPRESALRAILGALADGVDGLEQRGITAEAMGAANRVGLFVQPGEMEFCLPSLGDPSEWLPLAGGSLRNDEDGNSFLVADFSNGLRLSTLSILFLLSFIAGALVRYYPATSQALTSQRSGDGVFPVLQAAVSLVERRFPELAFERLNDDG